MMPRDYARAISGESGRHARDLIAPLTGLLQHQTTKAQINPGPSLWLDEKRGSCHIDIGNNVERAAHPLESPSGSSATFTFLMLVEVFYLVPHWFVPRLTRLALFLGMMLAGVCVATMIRAFFDVIQLRLLRAGRKADCVARNRTARATSGGQPRSINRLALPVLIRSNQRRVR